MNQRPPQNSEVDASGTLFSTDYIDVLHVVTQETRYDLLQNIVGHPMGAPSLEELTYMAAEVNNKTTVHEHLKKLINVGIVEKVKAEDQPSGYPRVFYRVPPQAMNLLQDRGLLEDVTALRQTYSAVEKPDRIERAEEAPRPSGRYEGELDTEAVKSVLREFAEQHEDPDEAVRQLRKLQGDPEDDDDEDQAIASRLRDAVNVVRGQADSQPNKDNS